MTGLFPCPYHDPTKPDCDHTKNCPLYIYEKNDVVCTALSPGQIAMVRGWVEGAAQEREEAGP